MPFALASAILVRVMISARLNQHGFFFISVFAFAANIAFDFFGACSGVVEALALAAGAAQALTCLMMMIAIRRLPSQDMELTLLP